MIALFFDLLMAGGYCYRKQELLRGVYAMGFNKPSKIQVIIGLNLFIRLLKREKVFRIVSSD